MLLRKFEIVVDTDEVLEYFLVFYDGYKWFDEFGRTYSKVAAWKIHEPYCPKQEKTMKQMVVVIGLDKEDSPFPLYHEFS